MNLKLNNDMRLYNVIFPIWFLIFFPPVIFISILGNFLIDSLVILFCFIALKIGDIKEDFKGFYKKSILWVVLFGFLSDIAGASILFATGILGSTLGIPHEIVTAINYDSFSNPVAVLIILISMLVSAFFIYLLNYRITFRELIKEERLRMKFALTQAILTMPWTFMLPTKWFY